MKPDCRDLESAMREPDGDLAEAFQSHLAECSACRAEMQLWREISKAAPALRKEWDSPDLWRRIQGGLGDGRRETMAERLAPPKPSRETVAPSGWGAWAAGLILAVLSTAVLWISLGPPPEAPRRTDRRNPLLTQRALAEVQRAEARYVESIERLAAVVEPKLSGTPTPLRINYREKLRLIDQAIKDIRADLEGNRFNAHIRAELLAAYRDKRDVLIELMEEGGR